MNKLKLSKRLQNICNLVENCHTVADIGCDHGKVVANLFLENKIQYAIASDISQPSVEKTRQLLTELGYIDQCSILVGDGLANIDPQTAIDCCIIAGMGGREIWHILTQSVHSITSWVLQPMKDESFLRKQLVSHGYKITKDIFFYDKGKYYTLLKVEQGKQRLNALQVAFGVTFEENQDFLQYANQELQNIKEYLESATTGKSKKDLKKRYQLLQKAIRRSV